MSEPTFFSKSLRRLLSPLLWTIPVGRRLQKGWPLRTVEKHRMMEDLLATSRAAPTGQRVLFWVPGGMPLMLELESAIAVVLMVRGIDIHAIICDGPYRACMAREVDDSVPVAEWQTTCSACRAATTEVLEAMAVPYSSNGDYVPERLRAQLWDATESIRWGNLDDVKCGDLPVGKNARSAIIRYLQGHSIDGHEEVVREYAYSALVSAAAAQVAYDRHKPDRVFTSHGTYVDWGPPLHTALTRSIPVTAWMGSYLTARFYFRHIDDGSRLDFHNMSDAAWEACRARTLSVEQNERLDAFLRDRYHKQVSFDMKHFHEYMGNVDALRGKYSGGSDKPVWGIMSHINWDCVSDYSPMAYETFDDWMLDTVRTIVEIPEVQWLVKVHPAEAWDNPDSGVQCLLDRHFPALPSHVRIIRAEEEISPLDFFHLVDGGVTVYGTSGLELALHGKPVILAGEAHYGGKGFTHDGLNPDDYRALLRKAASIPILTDEQWALARKYAYCYFVERQIPFPVVRDPNSTWWSFRYDKREMLLPGADPFVDCLCERIRDGQDFVMDEGLVQLAERHT